MGTFVEAVAAAAYAHIYGATIAYAHWLASRHTLKDVLYAHVERWAVVGESGGDGHALFYRCAQGACVRNIGVCKIVYRRQFSFTEKFSVSNGTARLLVFCDEVITYFLDSYLVEIYFSITM